MDIGDSVAMFFHDIKTLHHHFDQTFAMLHRFGIIGKRFHACAHGPVEHAIDLSQYR